MRFIGKDTSIANLLNVYPPINTFPEKILRVINKRQSELEKNRTFSFDFAKLGPGWSTVVDSCPSLRRLEDKAFLKLYFGHCESMLLFFLAFKFPLKPDFDFSEFKPDFFPIVSQQRIRALNMFFNYYLRH